MLRFPWRAADRGTPRQPATPAGLRELVDAAPTTLMLLDERAVIVHRSEGAKHALAQLLAADVSGSARRLAQGVSG